MSPHPPKSHGLIPKATCAGLRGVLCDIDDTLTWEGQLVPEAFTALHALRQSGLRIVPVTGRPGGWVDQIARLWPVDGVVGENGGLWFWRDTDTKQLVRRFAQSEQERASNRIALSKLEMKIRAAIPDAGIASDQPYRDLDLAVDFCEDIHPPLNDDAIDDIVRLFLEAGATCKVSSIHVNGWFGSFDKLSGCRSFVQERWGEDIEHDEAAWIYVGDSANDEPMFKHFQHSVGVANVEAFLPRMSSWPTYVTSKPGGHGFAQLAKHILANR